MYSGNAIHHVKRKNSYFDVGRTKSHCFFRKVYPIVLKSFHCAISNAQHLILIRNTNNLVSIHRKDELIFRWASGLSGSSLTRMM